MLFYFCFSKRNNTSNDPLTHLHALASLLSAATSIETILLFLTMSVPLALHERFVDFSKDGRFIDSTQIVQNKPLEIR